MKLICGFWECVHNNKEGGCTAEPTIELQPETGVIDAFCSMMDLREYATRADAIEDWKNSRRHTP